MDYGTGNDEPPLQMEPRYSGGMAGGRGGSGGDVPTNSHVAQLFTRLAQEIEESKPNNCVHFVVDFLCKHYPEHLHGFASIWQMDPDLEKDRHEVVNFFKAHKISTAVAAHFANAGYDTLDTLTTLTPDTLADIEAFNNVKWLPGHKVRLQQVFGEISARVRAYREHVGSMAAKGPSAHRMATAVGSYPGALAQVSTMADRSTYVGQERASASSYNPVVSALADRGTFAPATTSASSYNPAVQRFGIGGATPAPTYFPALTPPVGLQQSSPYFGAGSMSVP
jgi:hypothetical protein